jgi:ketosteroid isomerase-like protein
MNADELIRLVLSSFDAERQNDIAKGLELVTDDFKVTEMSMGNNGDVLFPSMSAETARTFIGQVYQIKERKYQFINAIADEAKQTVIIEFTETYPDPETGQVYLTPQVAVCEVSEGKIRRTRHYNDPRVSFVKVTQTDIDRALS